MKVHSIFVKIVVPISILMILMSCAILGVVGIKFTEAYQTRIYSENDSIASAISNSVEGFMDKAYRITDELANSREILTMDTQVQTPVLEGAVKRNDYFELLYIQDMNGDQTGRSSGELGNRAGRWWFIQMQETDAAFVSKSYYSISTNAPCASVFIPMKENEKTIGIMASDIKLDSLQKLVADYSDMNQGKISFIIDGEGVVVAHPESKYYQELYNYKNMTRTVTKVDASGNPLYDKAGNLLTEEHAIEVSEGYSQLVQDVMSGITGNMLVEDNNKEYYASYVPIELAGQSDGWSVITLTEKKQAMSAMTQSILFGIYVMVAAVVLAIIVLLILSKRITSPIKRCLVRLKLLSDGDLTTDVPKMNGRDEAAELLNTLRETIEILKGMIGNLHLRLDLLAEGDLRSSGTYEYKGQFNEMGKSLNQIEQSLNRSFVEIAKQTGDLYKYSINISKGTQKMSAAAVSQASAVEEIAATIKETSENISQNASATESANKKMEHVTFEMNASNEYIENLSESMERLYENALKIGGISKIIQDISFQTNILALNASVEAARAGEFGQGFSVIAFEVGDLANRCSVAAKETSELIDITMKGIEEERMILKETVEAIHTTTAESVEMKALIDSIAGITKRQAEAIDEISKALDQIAVGVQNNSEIAERNAVSSEELAQSAERLKGIIQKYQI